MAIVTHPPKSSSQAYVPQFSPRHLGYRMPAEWELHEATWLAWPHNQGTWPQLLEKVRVAYIELIKAISLHETVHLIVPNSDAITEAQSRLKHAACPVNVRLHIIPTNDAWIRDYGAMFVVRVDDETALPKRIGIDWGFNAWGNRYGNCDADNAVAPRMAQAMGNPSVSGGMVLEGGTIEQNGRGTLITTESVMLDGNRNANADREWFCSKALTMLGAGQVIWLEQGIADDATGGRVDQFARFAGPNRIALVADENPASANYEILRENRRRLRDARNPAGRPFDIVTLPATPPVDVGGKSMPASYANFYVTNGCVVVPQFGHASDRTACSTIQSLYPTRKVIGIDSRAIVRPQGGLHSLTLQVPAV